MLTSVLAAVRRVAVAVAVPCVAGEATHSGSRTRRGGVRGRGACHGATPLTAGVTRFDAGARALLRAGGACGDQRARAHAPTAAGRRAGFRPVGVAGLRRVRGADTLSGAGAAALPDAVRAGLGVDATVAAAHGVRLTRCALSAARATYARLVQRRACRLVGLSTVRAGPRRVVRDVASDLTGSAVARARSVHARLIHARGRGRAPLPVGAGLVAVARGVAPGLVTRADGRRTAVRRDSAVLLCTGVLRGAGVRKSAVLSPAVICGRGILGKSAVLRDPIARVVGRTAVRGLRVGPRADVQVSRVVPGGVPGSPAGVLGRLDLGVGPASARRAGQSVVVLGGAVGRVGRR